MDEIANMVGMQEWMNIIALKRVNLDGLQRLGLTTNSRWWKLKI